jgi:hypothetical protein
MKKVILIASLILVFYNVDAKKIPGKIVLNNGETIDVTFLIPFGFLNSQPTYTKLQMRARYVDRSGKKVVIKPDDAKEISFNFKGQNIRMISVNDDLGLQSIFSSQQRAFLKLEIDGALRLFTYYFTQNSPGMYNSATGTMSGGTYYNVDKFVLQKKNGPLKQPRGISFRKDMSEYFSDCPELVERIQKRDLRKGDLEIMVMEYNKKCAD